MITPDSPDRLYSTRRRTAVVLTGTGAAGAYQAGVLRALHEAGVRTDLVAGRGIGGATAMFAAIDGGARLWDPGGLWRGGRAAGFYRWRPALQVAGWAAVVGVSILLFPLLLLGGAIVAGLVGLLLTLVGLEHAGASLTVRFTAWLADLFAPGSLPTTVPRLTLLCLLVAAGALAAGAVGRRAASAPRRSASGWAERLWQLVGNPLSRVRACNVLTAELWSLIKGAAPVQQPTPVELGRRYVELLTDNLGQPGFRELLVLLHDVDARQDAVFAFLAEPHRARFFGRPARVNATTRQAEAFDLSGVARDHVPDVLAACLALPVATAPHHVRFAVEGPWRGETHRLLDRPGALPRLLEEVSAAGVEQVVLVAASPRAARPHELTTPRADLRGDAGEQIASTEVAVLRDAIEQFTGRFAGLFVIRPEHNPIAPLDLAGVTDERSDRRYSLAELVDRGYEDAYRQFIDPVVGASGERMESVTSRP